MTQQRLTRRQVLQVGAVSALGLTLPGASSIPAAAILAAGSFFAFAPQTFADPMLRMEANLPFQFQLVPPLQGDRPRPPPRAGGFCTHDLVLSDCLRFAQRKQSIHKALAFRAKRKRL